MPNPAAIRHPSFLPDARRESRRRTRAHAALAARLRGRPAPLPWRTPVVVELPLWVLRAGLADDYLDALADGDEFAAAARCRALKAGAREAAHG